MFAGKTKSKFLNKNQKKKILYSKVVFVAIVSR